MRSRTLTRLTLTGGALAAAVAPASAQALSAPALPFAGPGLAPLVTTAKTPLVKRDLRLARKVAHVKGTRIKRSYTKTIRGWSLTKLTRHHTHLKRELRRARRAVAERST